MSDRDLQTLSVLNMLVDRFGFRVLMPLRDATDMRTSFPDLFAVIARNGVSALPTRVTPPLVHALLGDLRQDLPRLVRSLRRPVSPFPSRTAGALSRHRPENSSSKRVPPNRRHHEGKRKSKPKHRRPN